MNQLDILQMASQNGILDLSQVQEQLEQMERNKILAQHKYWQDKNGYWHTWIPDKKNGRIHKKKKNKRDIEDCIIEYYKNNSKDKFRDVFYEWINSKLKYNEIARQTYDKYMNGYKRLIGNTEFDNTPISNITEGDIEDFIKQTILDLKLSYKGYSELRLLLRGVFRYAARHQRTNLDIVQFFNNLDLSRKIFNKKKRDPRSEVFTDDEFLKIYKYVMEEDTTVITLGILLAFYTGMRVGEISALQWADVNDRYIIVSKTEVHYKNGEGKTVFEVQDNPKTKAGNRAVILTDDAKKVLKRLRRINPFGEYIFMRNGERCHERAFTKKLYQVCEKVGIPKRSMHKARHTYATKLINAKVDDSLVISQMGHTNIQCTIDNYYGNNADFEKEKAEIQRAISW